MSDKFIPQLESPKPNIIFFGLRFFGHNFRILTCIFLLGITVTYFFENFIQTIFPSLQLSLSTSSTDDLSALAIIDRLNILNASWLIVSTFVELFLIAVIALIVKSIVEVVERNNPEINSILELKDLRSNIKLKDLIQGFLPVIFSKPMLKLTLLAIWRCFQFSIILLLLEALLNILLFNLGEGVVAILFIFFRVVSIVLTLSITILVVYNQYTFTDYLIDLKNLFMKRGGDLFNTFVFVIFMLVLTPTLMIAVIALSDTIGSLLNIPSVMSFINTLVFSYISGFLAKLYLIVVFIMIYNYQKSRN
ncbi:hypothetical protein CKF54_02210 [Psittacicella hinzii]|uniref:Uncharacterized protein n=1 Tax=Psittacicella hinzii TaxID=2028575 RepID=A0A3A1Y8C3_9GAMM|nr:hypothetical protein [Psittacicella hinzii]RIY33791.1 hypothetical protein CKF54_02210 [Psittacicella hinzii]